MYLEITSKSAVWISVFKVNGKLQFPIGSGITEQDTEITCKMVTLAIMIVKLLNKEQKKTLLNGYHIGLFQFFIGL